MPEAWADAQLAAAFTTAVNHPDAATRQRASARLTRWAEAAEAMRTGRVRVGSRTPVRGLPSWATLEVLRGGFASGRAVAGGPLEPDEVEIAEMAEVPGTRAAIFAWLMTDDGLGYLWSLLDSGRFQVRVPEDAALLTVAWLLRAGDLDGALGILDELTPLAGRLRFLPREADAAVAGDHVHRRSVGQARALLVGRRPRLAVEREREALEVWNPFTDRMLELWWASRDAEGSLCARLDDPWRVSASALMEEYAHLARLHPLCSKHKDPAENLARLIDGAREAVQGRLSLRQLSRVRNTVASIVTKRGAPGSAQLSDLRAQQRAVATAPRHGELAEVAAARLTDVPADDGLVDPSGWARPVTGAESVASGLAEGTAMPEVVHRLLAPTLSAPVEVLVARGVVPSAEVLAELLPQVTAVVVADGYRDPTLARVMAAGYRAFRGRRTLLLRNLAHQVTFEELPWVRATASYAQIDRPHEALDVARRVAALAMDGFPGTILPNPLISELGQLFAAGGCEVPLVEELAADIFQGRFSLKFVNAARGAGRLLAGTVYERYYGLNYQALGAGDQGKYPRRWDQIRHRAGTRAADGFTNLCRELAGADNGSSTASNGAVIEWSQILTTHNLAVLVENGAQPAKPWARLADEAWATTCELLSLAPTQPRPLSTVKNAAYAWRQALFFMALDGPDGAKEFLQRNTASARSRVPRQVLQGLSHIIDGGRFDADGRSPDGVRLTGWTSTDHWVLAEPRSRSSS